MHNKKLVKLIVLLTIGTVLTSPAFADVQGGVSGALAGYQGELEEPGDDAHDYCYVDSYDESYDDSYDDSDDDSYDDSYDDSDDDRLMDSDDDDSSDDSPDDSYNDDSYNDDSNDDDSYDDSSNDDDSYDDSNEGDSYDDSDDKSSDDSSEGTYLGHFKLTAYCNCAACNGSAGQPTASGKMPSEGRTVAMGGVDFGTKLSINGHIYTVEDTGTPYGHVDIFMESHSDADDFGVEYADVYLVE